MLYMIDAGGHTIGRARCATFSNRLYNFSGTTGSDPTLDSSLTTDLQNLCPVNGDGNNTAPLDRNSIDLFDNNHYFKNLLVSKGLLSSDQLLYSSNSSSTSSSNSSAAKILVENYSSNSSLFFGDFVISMIKMANIHPLTGSEGEIRKNCRVANSS